MSDVDTVEDCQRIIDPHDDRSVIECAVEHPGEYCHWALNHDDGDAAFVTCRSKRS